MSQRSRQDRVRQQQRRTQGKRAAGLGVLLLLLALGGLVLASALRSDSTSSDKGGTASGTVRVSMTEFAFAPDPIVLQHGAGARLEVANDGTTSHDLLISQLGKGTPDLPPRSAHGARPVRPTRWHLPRGVRPPGPHGGRHGHQAHPPLSSPRPPVSDRGPPTPPRGRW